MLFLAFPFDIAAIHIFIIMHYNAIQCDNIEPLKCDKYLCLHYNAVTKILSLSNDVVDLLKSLISRSIIAAN